MSRVLCIGTTVREDPLHKRPAQQEWPEPKHPRQKNGVPAGPCRVSGDRGHARRKAPRSSRRRNAPATPTAGSRLGQGPGAERVRPRRSCNRLGGADRRDQMSHSLHVKKPGRPNRLRRPGVRENRATMQRNPVLRAVEPALGPGRAVVPRCAPPDACRPPQTSQSPTSGFCAQLEALNLSGRGLGQVRADLDPAGILPKADGRLHMVDQRRGVDPRLGIGGDHECLWLF